jgi:hypothetical protein
LRLERGEGVGEIASVVMRSSLTWLVSLSVLVTNVAWAAEHTTALLKERRAALIAAAVTGRVSVPPNPLPQPQEGLC